MQFLVLLGLGVWVIWADPFGLSTASERALAQDISRSRALMSPVPAAPITVVTIDYKSIENLHTSEQKWLSADDWPLSYEDHVRILRKLVTGGREGDAPAAVFYDIFFERPRSASGDMGTLARALSRIGQDAPGPDRRFAPVYLAGGGVQMPMSTQAYQALGQPALAASAWQGQGEYYPLSSPLHPAGTEPGVPDHAPSAASAMYQALCQARGQDCSWLRDSDAMALQWVLREGVACSDRMVRIPRYALTTAVRYLGFGDAPEAVETDCLPFHQVQLDELFSPTGRGLRPPHLQPGEPYIVLAGVVMPSLNDYHETPVYEKIAGVYVHAMALENLVRMGSDHLRNQNIRWVSTALWALIALGLCCWHAIWREPCMQRWRVHRRDPGKGRLSRGLHKVRTLGRHVQRRLSIRFRQLLRMLHVPRNTRLVIDRSVRTLIRRILGLVLWITIIVGVYLLCYSVLDIALEGWLFMVGLVSLTLFWKGAAEASESGY